MRRLIAILIGVVVGGSAVFGAFQYHLIRARDRWAVVKKQRADWREAYVDVRTWGRREWSEHQELSANVTAAGHGDLLPSYGPGEFFRGLFDPLRPNRSSNPREIPQRSK
jgi:hypothetical protein